MAEIMLKREVTQEEVDQLYNDKDVFALLFANDEPDAFAVDTANEQEGAVKPEEKKAPSPAAKMLSQEEMLKRFQPPKKGVATKPKTSNDIKPTAPVAPSKEQPKEKQTTQKKVIQYKEIPLTKGKKIPGQSTIGLDIGYDSVKLAFLPTGMNQIILDTEIITGSNGKTINEQATIDAIQTLLDRNKIKKKEAVACFSERYLFLRILTVVKMNQKELESALFFEAKKHHIPFDIDTAIIRYTILREIKDNTGEKYEILLAAAPNEIPEAITSIVKAAGLKPLAIDFGSKAILRVLRLRYTQKNGSLGVILNIGDNKTLVTLVNGSDFLWAKDIAIGSKSFVEAVADYLMLPIAKAEEMMKVENDFKVVEAMKPIVDQLILELSRALEYGISIHKSDNIHQILLCGNTEKITGLEKILTEHFDIPITKMNPAVSVKSKKMSATINPEYITAVGLTLRNKKSKEINLLPSKSNQKSLSLSIPKVRFGSTFLILFTIILLVSPLVGIPLYLSREIAPLKNDLLRYQAIINSFADIQKKLDDQMIVRRKLDNKKTEIAELKKESQLLSSPLSELSKILPKGISILSVTFVNKKFTVKGLVKKNSTLETFFNNLKSSYHFDRVSNVIVRKKQNLAPYKLSFVISFFLSDK